MEINDLGGRRSGFNRRQFSYSSYMPERRSDTDRRSGFDQRCGSDRRDPKGFRSLVGMDRRKWFGKPVEALLFV